MQTIPTSFFSTLTAGASQTCFRDVEKLFGPGALHDAVDLNVGRVDSGLRPVAEPLVRVDGPDPSVQDYGGVQDSFDGGGRSPASRQRTRVCSRAIIAGDERQESHYHEDQSSPWWLKIGRFPVHVEWVLF